MEKGLITFGPRLCLQTYKRTCSMFEFPTVWLKYQFDCSVRLLVPTFSQRCYEQAVIFFQGMSQVSGKAREAVQTGAHRCQRGKD